MAVYRGVLLYGDSGNGKSSLINAGLMPEAHELGFQPVRVRVQPRAGAELVVEQIAVPEHGGELLASSLLSQHPDAPRAVMSIDEFEALVLAMQTSRPLVVFDQFEEIVTLFEAAPDSRLALADMLVRLLRASAPLKLVFVFREDYLGRVKQLLDACPELVDQALRLGPPSADALMTIIRGPFERFPGMYDHELDEALADRLAAELANRFGSGEISLSEVQSVCLRLWHSANPEALLDQKGVRGLLEDELGEVLDALSPGLRLAAVALLSHMVTSAGTRNVISAEDLHERVRGTGAKFSPALVEEALGRLERDSKLVRRERRRELDLYEITSEFLVPWISSRREALQLAEERRSGRRRLRIAASIATALLVLVVAVGVVAVWALAQRAEVRDQRAQAQRQSQRAEREASDARALALASSSAAPLSTRPDVSLELALAADSTRRRPEVSQAVVQSLVALRRSGLRAVFSAADGLSGIAFRPDGKDIAAASHDGTVRVWSLASHQVRVVLRSGQRPVNAVAYDATGKRLAAAGTDRTVRVWDPSSGALIKTLRGHRRPVLAVAFSHDRRTLASAGQDGTIRLWNVGEEYNSQATLAEDIGNVFALAYSRAGMLASAGADGTIRLWDPRSRRQIRQLAGHTDVVHDIAFSRDGTKLASASWDSTIRVWSAATGSVLATLRDTHPINGVAFNHDGRRLASAGSNRTVRIWSVTTGRPLARLTGHASSVLDVAFNPRGRDLASSSADNTVRSWNPERKIADRLTGHRRNIFAVAYSPNGERLASAGYDRTILIRNGSDHTRRARLTGHTNTVSALAFSLGGQRLASASYDGTVRIWSVDGSPVTRLAGPRAKLTTLAFSPHGSLAFAGFDSKIRIWNPAKRKRTAILRGHAGTVWGLAFSPDGSLLASVGSDRKVRLWDPVSHERRHGLTGHGPHRGTVTTVAFSPDGETLATAGFDGTVLLWDVSTRRWIGTLRGHTSPIRAVAFSPDHRAIASGGDDGTVILWDAVSRQQLGRLAGHTRAVNALAFSPDRRTLVSASDDGTLRSWDSLLWNVGRRSRAALRATICRTLSTVMTLGEWARYARGITYQRTCP